MLSSNLLYSLRLPVPPEPPKSHMSGMGSAKKGKHSCPLKLSRGMISAMSDPLDRLRSALAGRYEIDRELGRGGMATVYLAQDIRHARKVALKVVDSQAADADRFLREIRTAAQLTHPHILPVHDSGAADGVLFFVMPFVEGESLRDRLRREKQLPVLDGVSIVTEVARALDYAHRHGVVHRDIKPENILLQDGHAVVADFGIASAMAGDATALTATGVVIGTPAYMSPEQASGQAVDGRSDLYSLGCVLYEILAGVPPFAHPALHVTFAQRLDTPAPRVSTLRPTVPHAVDEAVATALQVAPADRFRTLDAFAAALHGDRETVGTPLLRGRTFDPRDRAGSPLVAIVSQSFAKRHFGDADPIGRRIGQSVPEIEIVGVVGDAKYQDGRRAPREMFFIPYLQETADSRARAIQMGVKLDRSRYPQAIELLTDGAVAGLESEVRRAMAEVDRRITVRSMVTMDEQVARAFNMDRLIARLTGAFGLVAVLLACLGLYGVTAVFGDPPHP